jgi:uncharacterized membrane-anchored protein YitT (DUF2179 family)
MPSERVRTAIIAVVTTVWAVNFVAGLTVADYEPDQAINAIFMAIVGGLFALGARHNSGGGDHS